jgi:hypothetical protein
MVIANLGWSGAGDHSGGKSMTKTKTGDMINHDPL